MNLLQKLGMSISPYLIFCQRGLATATSCEPFNLPVSATLFWLPTSLDVNPSSTPFMYGGFLLLPQNYSPTAGFLGRWFFPYGVLPLFFQYTMDQTSIFWGFCSYKNGKTLLIQKTLLFHILPLCLELNYCSNTLRLDHDRLVDPLLSLQVPYLY